jgi:hypothetical protein
MKKKKKTNKKTEDIENAKLYNLHTLHNIPIMVRSITIRWAGNVERTDISDGRGQY